MKKLILLIWITLIGYKLYDLHLAKIQKQQEKEQLSYKKQLKKRKETKPVFDANWKGHVIVKNTKPASNKQMSKAIPTKTN